TRTRGEEPPHIAKVVAHCLETLSTLAPRAPRQHPHTHGQSGHGRARRRSLLSLAHARRTRRAPAPRALRAHVSRAHLSQLLRAAQDSPVCNHLTTDRATCDRPHRRPQPAALLPDTRTVW